MNSCCGTGSVTSSQLLLITQHKLIWLPARSGQLRCDSAAVWKLHRQTAGAPSSGGVLGLDPQVNGFTCNGRRGQDGPTALSGSPT